ncbi:MAG: hypothetical protein WCO53_14955 [Deltaproteobacteria bacterium]
MGKPLGARRAGGGGITDRRTDECGRTKEVTTRLTSYKEDGEWKDTLP